MIGIGRHWRTSKSWPLRLQLTVWYLLLTGLIIASFGIYLFTLTRLSMVQQVDQSLAVAESQVRAGIDTENGRPIFQPIGQPGDTAYRVAISGFAARIVSSDGTVRDGIGAYKSMPSGVAPKKGLSTAVDTQGADWRILSWPLNADSSTEGSSGPWLQVAQSLSQVDKTMERLKSVLLVSIPVLLVLIGIGGLFLSNRALRPIRHVVAAMHGIEPDDLSARLDQRRSPDEIGSLIEAFNGMLDRIERGFLREQQFTQDVAHELRTPLTVLRGQIEVGLSRKRSGTEYRETLEALGGQVDRLVRLTSDLLFLARFDHGTVATHMENTRLDSLLLGVVEQITPLAKERGLHIQTEVEHPIVLVGDSDQLVRLFLNILDNALKYNVENGEIKIHAECAEDEISVSVYNTGPIIPKNHIPNLFDRFYRADTDRSRRTGGSGLGLSIAAEIVRQMHGTIVMESAPRGNAVVLTFPTSSSSSE